MEIFGLRGVCDIFSHVLVGTFFSKRVFTSIFSLAHSEFLSLAGLWGKRTPKPEKKKKKMGFRFLWLFYLVLCVLFIIERK